MTLGDHQISPPQQSSQGLPTFINQLFTGHSFFHRLRSARQFERAGLALSAHAADSDIQITQVTVNAGNRAARSISFLSLKAGTRVSRH